MALCRFCQWLQLMGGYRLFASALGPPKATPYTGSFVAGLAFEVSTSGTWFEGYWWWVCNKGQVTSPQPFALWQAYSDQGTLISRSTLRSAPLLAGQWNYVPLTAPLPLAIGVTYVAATGLRNGFPSTQNFFGAGDASHAGIKKGPLFAYSDQSGKHPAQFSISQCPFRSDSSDPTARMPAYGFDSSNYWLDVQITDEAPKGDSYRLWPSYPTPPHPLSHDTGQQTTGTEFWLSEPCRLEKMWFYSPPGVSVLPSRCAIFDVATKAVVAGTNKNSPHWSGAPGSGWVSSPYGGLTLPAGRYKACIYYGGGEKFYTEDVYYFTTGAGAAGITAGPLSSPNVAHAAPCMSNGTAGVRLGAVITGNSTYQDGPFSYPYTFDSKDHGENRWIDVEVAPLGAPGVNSGAFFEFFPERGKG